MKDFRRTAVSAGFDVTDCAVFHVGDYVPFVHTFRGMRLKNPLNGDQGISKAAVFASARSRKAIRGAVLGTLTCMRKGLPGLPVMVTITRVAPSNGLDDDNLRAACKSVRDGVADFYAMNDRDPRLEWRYAQERGRKGQYDCRIKIERRTT